MQDWLYTDGEDASATNFQERLDQLKAIGDPIFFRCANYIVGFVNKSKALYFYKTYIS